MVRVAAYFHPSSSSKFCANSLVRLRQLDGNPDRKCGREAQLILSKPSWVSMV